MRSLDNNTLEDIAKYSDKTFKLFNYMTRSSQPLMISELAKITQTPDTVELIEAFRKDVAGTANMLEKAHALLSTVDDNDFVAQLKGDTKDLKTAFGEQYDPVSKTINMGGIVLPLKKDLSKDNLKDIIVQSILGVSNYDFDKLFKNRKSIYKLDESSLTNDNERIEFLSIVKSQNDYKEIIEKMEALHKSFIVMRATFSEEEKQKIDREITFSRSMIDSVTKQSTFLTKDDGLIQVANDHKSQDSLLKELHEKTKSSPYIKAIELDKDSSIENVIQVMNQLEEINLGLGKEVVFKVRKLGNYNLSGMYVDSQNIVAVDISEPSSMIREFTEAVNYSNNMLSSTVDGQNMIKRFKYKIDRNNLSVTNQNQYLKNTGVMARLGEIAYMFDKYELEEGEDIKDFISRVQDIQGDTSSFELSMIKPVDYYIDSIRREIYFNLEDWTEEDIKICQNFYAGVFNAKNKELEPINPVPTFKEPVKTSFYRKERTRYELSPVSLINEDNIAYLMDYNLTHEIVGFDKLINEIFTNIPHIDRTTKAYNRDQLSKQRKTLDKFAEWLEKNQNPYFMYLVYNQYVSLLENDKFTKEMFLYKSIKEGHSDKFLASDWIKEEEEKLDSILGEIKEAKKSTSSSYEQLRNLQMEYRDVKLSSVRKSRELLKSLYPEFLDIVKTKKDVFVTSEDKKYLTDLSKKQLFASSIKTIMNYAKDNGLDSILAFDKPENNLFEKVLNLNNVRSGILKQHVVSNSQIYDSYEQKNGLKSLANYLSVFNDMSVENPFINPVFIAEKDQARSGYSMRTEISVINQFNLMDIYNHILPEYNYKSQADSFYDPNSLNRKRLEIINNITRDLTKIIKPIVESEDKSFVYDNLIKKFNVDQSVNEVDNLLSMASELSNDSESPEDLTEKPVKTRRMSL